MITTVLYIGKYLKKSLSGEMMNPAIKTSSITNTFKIIPLLERERDYIFKNVYIYPYFESYSSFGACEIPFSV